MLKFLAILSLLFISTPARADGFKDREIVFQALNVVDAIQTCSFLSRGTARELNPILGSNPSCEKVVGFKIAVGALHYLAAKALNRHDEKTAKIFQITTIGVQGAAVTWNMQF
jgi:hypothetical protein